MPENLIVYRVVTVARVVGSRSCKEDLFPTEIPVWRARYFLRQSGSKVVGYFQISQYQIFKDCFVVKAIPDVETILSLLVLIGTTIGNFTAHQHAMLMRNVLSPILGETAVEAGMPIAFANIGNPIIVGRVGPTVSIK